MCVTGIPKGRSSPVRTSVNADNAEHTVASGAWKGGLMDEIIEGVKTRTLGGWNLSAEPTRAVRRGRKACIVRIGCRRCVLNRLAKLDGGIVAMGDVW